MGLNCGWTCRKGNMWVVLEVVLLLAQESSSAVHLAEDHTDHTERMML